MKISRQEHEVAREIIRHKLGTFKSHREIDGALDALLESLGIEVEKSILDEKWEYEDGDVYDASGEYVLFDEFKQQIAALSDALRALVMIQNYGNHNAGLKIYSEDGWRLILDALAKAGIE